MLIVFGGLPGTGKTTLAQAVAARYGAVYLRIDTIEQAIHSSDVLRDEIGSTGYLVACRLAEENLRLAASVVADAVNPVQVAREAWAEVARNAFVTLIEIEVICSDRAEHRRRVETRPAASPGVLPVSWIDVSERYYEPWSMPHLVVDTAQRSVREAEQELMRLLAADGRVDKKIAVQIER